MYQRISVQQAKNLLDTAGARCVDIRDNNAFAQGHIPGASPLSQDNLADFLASCDHQQPLLVCCYHGNSSQSAAHFLAEKGFTDVFSIDGGFAAWQSLYPVATSD